MERDNKSTGQQARSYPTSMVILCAIVSLSNPLLAPAVMYYIFKASRSWSKSKPSRAYRHVNKAAGVTITGIVVTGAALIAGVFVFAVVKEKNNIDKKSTIDTTTKTTTTTYKSTFRVKSTVHEPQQLTTNSSKSQTHIENAFPYLATETDISRRFINNTHVSIEFKRNNTRKILPLRNISFA